MEQRKIGAYIIIRNLDLMGHSWDFRTNDMTWVCLKWGIPPVYRNLIRKYGKMVSNQWSLGYNTLCSSIFRQTHVGCRDGKHHTQYFFGNPPPCFLTIPVSESPAVPPPWRERCSSTAPWAPEICQKSPVSLWQSCVFGRNQRTKLFQKEWQKMCIAYTA